MTIKEWFNLRARRPILFLILMAIFFESIFLFFRIRNYHEQQQAIFDRVGKTIELGISQKNRDVMESAISIAVSGLNASQFLLCLDGNVEIGFPTDSRNCKLSPGFFELLLSKELRGAGNAVLLARINNFPNDGSTSFLLIIVILSIALMIVISLKVQTDFYVDVVSGLTKGLMGDEPLKLQEMEKLRQMRLDNVKKEKDLAIQKVRDQITRQVAHDIMSPLGALKTASQSLEKNPKASKALIHNSIKRVDAIIDDLRTSTKVGIERSKKEKKKVKIELLLRSIIESKLNEFPNKNINIKLASINPELSLIIEPFSVERAISNILNNSIEATASSKILMEISIGESEDSIQIEVKDFGKGIRRETLNKVFDDHFTEGKPSGNGLGLHYAKLTMTEHSGEITIESEIGKGTSVILNFPKNPHKLRF